MIRNAKGQFVKGHESLGGMTGKKQSLEARRKMSIFQKERFRKSSPWNKGKKGLMPTPWNKGLKGIGCGEKNGMWKGNKAGYVAFHIWIKVNFGKATYCSNNPIHTSKRFEWANISGEYKRDISDYKPLCVPCHRKDGIRKPERFLQND